MTYSYSCAACDARLYRSSDPSKNYAWCDRCRQDPYSRGLGDPLERLYWEPAYGEEVPE